MHSPPIDLLARAPKTQDATPTKSEPDGRFSELLRDPSKADHRQQDVSADRKPEQAAPSPGPVKSETEISANVQAPVELPADPASPAIPTSASIGPDQLAIIPEGVTLAQPHPALPVFGDVEGLEMQAGISSAPAPNPGNSIVTPQATVPVPETIGTPVPIRSADGAIRVPQPIGPAIPANPDIPANLANLANPADRANPASPETSIKPGISDATVPVTRQSPTAAMQIATGGPVTPAVEALARSTVAGKSVTTPSVTQPTGDVTGDVMDEAISDRPTIAVTPRAATPRSAAPTLATPLNAVPPDNRETLETAGPKVTPQPIRAIPTSAAATPPAATTAATSAATATASAAMLAGSKPGTVATTSAIPSTVAEIADTPTPTSQPVLNSATAMTPGQAGPAPAATASAAGDTHSQAATQPVSEQVVLQVRRAVREGVDRLTVQLKPASLGRVDVQMEVGHDGRVQAIISAERPETLHLLQRDARALSEALSDAGLQTDSGSLSFNLRGQSGDDAGGNGQSPSDGAPVGHSNTADDIDQATTQITLTLGDGRVDIKV